MHREITQNYSSELKTTHLISTLMLLVDHLTNTKWCKKPEKWLKPWYMGTHLRVLSESYLMNTNNWQGLDGFKDVCILVLQTKVASALEGLFVCLFWNYKKIAANVYWLRHIKGLAFWSQLGSTSQKSTYKHGTECSVKQRACMITRQGSFTTKCLLSQYVR